MSAQEHAVYRFAECELDARERRLQVHGHAVTLTPKVFDTLVLLVEHAGHVVSKDELMAALWPRGFVHESNLTKHIWMIRHALGDGEDENRYIETVPKLGYRFSEPVQRVACADAAVGETASEGTGAQAPPDALAADDRAIAVPVTAIHREWVAGRDPERRNNGESTEVRGQALAADAPHGVPTLRRGDRVWLTAIGLMMVVVAGALYWWRTPATPSIPASISDAGAVAIVDFNNLSGNGKDAWLGPALEQMLATEIAAGGKLHAVPEELVRPARADLPAPDAGGYAPASLATLQRRLGARYVLSGAYLVSGNPDAPQLRVDLTVQDAQSGASFASVSHSAAVNDLPQLVAQVGNELRGRFGERSDPATLKQIASAQPDSAEVARHLGFALQALDQSDAARARDELLQAIAQAPGYAPAYLYLARAWSALGYRAKAIAASKQALQNAEGLPQEQRLQIEAQQFTFEGDHAKAAGIWTKLVALRPQDPDYRLQLAGKLADAAKYDDASVALAAARKLPGANGDPRYDLAAAEIEYARGNNAAVIPHARLALQRAQQRGETGLVAQAELQLGIVLDRAGEPQLRKAAADFRAIGNPHGEARAYQNLGNLMNDRNQIAAARENYQRAMTIYQGVGDLGGEAAIYDDLSRMLWSAGDRDGTETALRQALAIGRETDDKVRQAWSLTGLATVLSDESAGDDVVAMYREAIALDQQSGERAHLAFALATYADLLRVRGELDAARDACEQARQANLALDASSRTVTADFECAQVALDRGDVDVAVAAFTRIEQGSIAAKDGFDAANAQLVLGQIAMGRLQWADARDALQRSRDGWAAAKATAGEATASALLALCDTALRDNAARDAALKRARDLRSQLNERQEVLYLDIALAELQAQPGQPEEPLEALRGYADDATKRKWIGYAFEARLAMLRVLDRGNDLAAIKSSRDALAADARKAGFGWVSQRVVSAPSAPARGQR